jgi:hypothetical protein
VAKYNASDYGVVFLFVVAPNLNFAFLGLMLGHYFVFRMDKSAIKTTSEPKIAARHKEGG